MSATVRIYLLAAVIAALAYAMGFIHGWFLVVP